MVIQQRLSIATAKKNRHSLAVSATRIRRLCQLGSSYTRKGEYGKAEASLKEAIDVSTAQFGRQDWLTYTALNNYAVLCKYLGRFKRADQIYQQTLQRLAAATEPRLHELATLYHNMGGLEHARNRPDLGEPLARKSVQIRQSLLGSGDLTVAEDEAALGAIMDARHKHLAARRLYFRALKIFRAHPAGHRYDLAVTLNNLGASYHATGDLNRGERYYEQALEIKKKLFGSRHVDVALTMNNLAILCQARRDWQRAEELLHAALAIFRATLSARHPKLAACRENYARLLAERKLVAPRATLPKLPLTRREQGLSSSSRYRRRIMATKPTTKNKKTVKLRDMSAKKDVKAGKTTKGIAQTQGLRTNHHETLIIM